jgi:hypothetical protein
LLALALLAGRAPAQEARTEPARFAGRPALRASPLPPHYEFDGRTAGPAWQSAVDSIADLATVEPEEGGVPAGRTIVKVFADADEIVVAVRCDDGDAAGIVSYSKARDAVLDEEDHVVIVFDTFLDARSGYVFAVNPSGARFDALVVDRETVTSEWDAAWEAKTSREAGGWSAEIRIPILSLGFKKDLARWGFNVQRRVQRLQETSRWSGISVDYWVTQTSRAGLLVDLPAFRLGTGLTVRPAAVARVRKPGPWKEVEYDADFSLDMNQKLGPNLLSSLTVNTDFAETEVDVRQINLTRFDIFFPEKRSFFLEGADIFEFGLGLDPEENLLPFFSRRIGLHGLDAEDQVAIPINAGGKIHGRIGATNVGALVVNTRKVNGLEVEENYRIDVPQATMGAVRVSQNVLEESALGVLATFGDQLGRSGSWLAGVDFTYETSGFRGGKNFLFGAWGLLDDRTDLEGDKSAHGFRIEYPNDLLDLNATSIHIGDGFEPSLGFVPRNDVHIWDFGSEFNPRPGWSWLRQMFYEFSFTIFNKRDNSRWESYGVTVKPLDWLLESGERFEAGVEPGGDRPSAAFEIVSDVDVAPGSYEWIRYFVAARSAEKRRLSGEIRWELGTYYDGDLGTLEARLTLKPSALYTVELTGERNTGETRALIDDFETRGMQLVEKRFTEESYGVRLQVNVTSNMQLSSLTQYDTQSKELGTNNRLRWTFDPLGDLFVVYNHNLRRMHHASGSRCWQFVSNELPVKIQYGRRF